MSLDDDNKTELTDSNNTSLLKQSLFFFGPLFASFHVATYIVGFFGVGAVAKWIIEQWFPFTRFLWTVVFEFFSSFFTLPNFNDVEKDALTTLVFFAPLGFYAVFKRKRHPLDGKYAVFAWIIGGFFISIVGLQLIQAVLDVAFDFGNSIFPKTRIGTLIIVLSSITGIIMVFKKLPFAPNLDHWFEMSLIYRISLMFFVLIFYYVITRIGENVYQLGTLTFLCFLFVIIFALLAIVRTPYRLSWGLGSLIAFIISGLLFELVIIFADFIKKSV